MKDKLAFIKFYENWLNSWLTNCVNLVTKKKKNENKKYNSWKKLYLFKPKFLLISLGTAFKVSYLSHSFIIISTLFCLFQRIFANKIGGNKQLLLSVGMKEGRGYQIHHSVLFCKSGVQEFRPNLAGFSVPSRVREFNLEYSGSLSSLEPETGMIILWVVEWKFNQKSRLAHQVQVCYQQQTSKASGSSQRP